MAIKACSECKKEISTEASVCPNCGKKKPTSSGTPPVVWGIVIILVLAAIGSSGNRPTPQQAEKTAPPTAQQIAEERARVITERKQDAIKKKRDSVEKQISFATQLCREAAEKSLKSPATANFHDDETASEDLGKGRSHVQLQVDAENSFGALMRTTVDCKTRQTKTDIIMTAFNSWGR
jgi:hypothetical protein